MGTRGLTMVIEQEKPVIAQYGQWDHYPSGQGATILDFLRKNDLKAFREKLKNIRFINESEVEEIDRKSKADKNYNWIKEYPQMSRDVGGDILEMAMKHEGEFLLQDHSKFAGDSLFCEYAYVVDFDKNTFEIYKGFNKTPLVEGIDRFFSYFEQPEHRTDVYYPVKLLKSYSLDELPDEEQMIEDCTKKDDDDE